MDEFELTVFEQTTDYSELRCTHAGVTRTRALDRKAIDTLVEAVERSYSRDELGHRVFGSAQLQQLGGTLFEFLDGPERWLSQAQDPRGALLRIDAGERLRHLPWELMATAHGYLAVAGSRATLPVRVSSQVATVGTAARAGNRPLRVLFMATSPEGIEPALGFEAEEAAILNATADAGIELVVEESGTLDGLRFTVESYEEGYFDVLHLSGHATITGGRPAFLVENELGGPLMATADQIARAMAGRWPRLLFLSGCLTGSAPGGGTIPSMSESLVTAGAPTVLGWALPVGDVSATAFADELYSQLAAGRRVDESVVAARKALYADHSPYWHLLRVYADRSPFAALVTARNTPGRERIRLRGAGVEFLDPQTRISRVASRSEFVGRRRVIQRCLRTLKAPLDSEDGAPALVLHGMGGLGKSTLASRLLERMPTHQRVVWFGGVDQMKLGDLISKTRFESPEQQVQASEYLNETRVPLTDRLTYLFDGPLGRIPCLFVFDDFEQGNLDARAGGHVLSGEMAEILPAFLSAIDQTNSPSRVIITSRYRFSTPAATKIAFEGLETLTPLEQTKKIANLPNLRPDTRTSRALKARAIEAAAGNPRLLDWLDRIVNDSTLDVESLVAAIENETDRFLRENIFAQKLLDSQGMDLRKMLAKVNAVELPIPAQTVHALHDHPDVATHVQRAADLGLLEEGTDPETGEPRYFVSNVLRPLIRPLLSEDEYIQACAAAARSLYAIWVDHGTQGSAN